MKTKESSGHSMVVWRHKRPREAAHQRTSLRRFDFAKFLELCLQLRAREFKRQTWMTRFHDFCWTRNKWTRRNPPQKSKKRQWAPTQQNYAPNNLGPLLLLAKNGDGFSLESKIHFRPPTNNFFVGTTTLGSAGACVRVRASWRLNMSDLHSRGPAEAATEAPQMRHWRRPQPRRER